MDVRELLLDLFGRAVEHVEAAVTGLDVARLMVSPEPGSNPIGWLVWHLARQEDAQVAELAGGEQVWMTGTWAEMFGVPMDPANHGYGHTAADVATVRPQGADVLLGYYSAVAARTREFIESIDAETLDRVIDENWDPPVTVGVRLISVADDAIQHGGQAAYVRGLLERR